VTNNTLLASLADVLNTLQTSSCMARWPLWHEALTHNYRQISHNFSWWNIFDDMCRIHSHSHMCEWV